MPCRFRLTLAYVVLYLSPLRAVRRFHMIWDTRLIGSEVGWSREGRSKLYDEKADHVRWVQICAQPSPQVPARENGGSLNNIGTRRRRAMVDRDFCSEATINTVTKCQSIHGSVLLRLGPSCVPRLRFITLHICTVDRWGNL